MNPIQKLIEMRDKGLVAVAPKLMGTTIIFERPEVSFTIHPDFAGEVYRITDPRLDDETTWGNPWAAFAIFVENINNYIASGKKVIVMKYNIFVVNEIGCLYLSMQDKLKRPFCLAFYHNGEKLTLEPEDFTATIDVKTTALNSMQYFDFIVKHEIPIGYEIAHLP